MKFSLKRILAIILSAVMVFCSITCMFTTVADTVETNISAKYTFDEANTDYWSATASSQNTTFALGDGGNGGNSLIATYTQGDKALITFDYTLKSNTKYFISYKYKGSSWDVQLVNSGSRIACGEEGTLNYNPIAAFLGTTAEYEPMHTEWKTRTILFDTGDSIVESNINKLAFHLSFDKVTGRSLYIDNITINEVAQFDSYSTDFSEGLENSGIFNYSPLTDLEVTADAADASNNVLKLHKEYNKGAEYNLYVPIKLTAGEKYTLSYKYRTTSTKQVGLSTGAKVGLLNSNGFENSKIEILSQTQFTDILGGFTSDTYNASAWPKIPANCNWITRTETFEVTNEMIEAGASAVGIALSLYYADPVDALDVYLDDIKVIKHNKITLNTNGGVIDDTVISAVAGDQVALPAPSKEGFTFAGWYTDADLTVEASTVMPSRDIVYYAKWLNGEKTYVKYTFDEENTDYWSAYEVEHATGNSVDMEFAVTANGQSGNGISSAYGIYDQVSIAFDYTLKNNTKYVVSYQYKANSGSATLNHTSSKIAVGEIGSSDFKELAQFTTATGWVAIGTNWTTRTAIIETGADTVTTDLNKLVFKLYFGTAGSIYIDNVTIAEIKTSASFETNFTASTDNLDIINYEPSSDIEVVSDPLDGTNKVLKFTKSATVNSCYKLLIPVDVVVGDTYTISYKYRTDAASAQGLNTGAKLGIANYNAQIATEIGYLSNDAIGNGGWGNIPAGDSWTERTLTFTATEENMANTSGNFVMNFDLLYYKPAAATNTYFDDIKVIRHSTLTFNAGEGTVDTETITGLKDTVIELPTPFLDGAIFKGWFEDTDSTVSATNIMPAVDTTYYAKWEISPASAKFTFDEENTNYWSVGLAEYSGEGNATMDFAITDGGYEGKALSTPYGIYDKALITFDYALKNNAKYMISYQYKASNGSATLNHASCNISIGKVGTTEYKALAPMTLGSGWGAIGTGWTTRTTIIETDADTAEADVNRLAFYIYFGAEATFFIDNVSISEIKTTKNYETDFTTSTDDLGIINCIPSTNAEIVTDPLNVANDVLKLAKPENAGVTYKLLIPANIVAGKTYTIKYKYRTDAPSQLSMSPSAKIGISDYNAGLAKEIGWVIANAQYQGNYGKIDPSENWSTRNLTYTATETDLADNSGNLIIDFAIYNAPTSALNLYIDDISVTEHATITFEANGGVVDTNSVTASEGSVVELPVPTKEGYTFKGWYSNEELTAKVDNIMPKLDATYYAYWYIKGDANGDCDVNSLDLVVLRNILLGNPVEYSADGINCNDDDVVDARDIVRLKKIIVDVYTSYIPSNYNLVWSEEFSGTVGDTNMMLTGGHSMGENSVNTAENVSVKDGSAVMSVTYDAESEKYNLPMSLSTNDTMNFKYGFVEIRAKVPYMAEGEWPAFWLISSAAALAKEMDSYTIPEYFAEIDLFEQITYGPKFQTQLHLWASSGTSHKENILGDNSKYSFVNLETANQWHTYGFKWTEECIEVYVDGILAFTAIISENYRANFAQYTPLRLSLQYKEYSGFFEENPDSSIDMEIDYVRLYQDSATDRILVKN